MSEPAAHEGEDAGSENSPCRNTISGEVFRPPVLGRGGSPHQPTLVVLEASAPDPATALENPRLSAVIETNSELVLTLNEDCGDL